MPFSRGRTICFIDNANILGGQIDAGWRIDWRAFHDHLEETGQVWQFHFFAATPEDGDRDEGGTSIFNFLRTVLRWEVHLYDLGLRTTRCEECGETATVPTEKGVDVGLATEVLMLAFNRAYDTAILVSGDRDFLGPVRHVKRLGLRVEIAGWRRSMSRELAAESSAQPLWLDDLQASLELRR